MSNRKEIYTMPITEQKCMGAGCSDKAVAEYLYKEQELYYCRAHSDQFRNQTCATKQPETEEELAVAQAEVRRKEIAMWEEQEKNRCIKAIENSMDRNINNILLNSLVDQDLSKPVKFDNGKPTYDLIPWVSLTELAKLYEFGANKYAADNWRLGNGLSYRRCFNGIVRHLLAWIAGVDEDEETKLHPLASVAFYCFAVIYYEKTGNKTDDRRIEDGR